VRPRRCAFLITNDDGIHAPALPFSSASPRLFRMIFLSSLRNRIQSGVSHSLTINDPLRLRKISGRHFAVKGTPTDCVIMGVRRLLDGVKPDLVLSGVNNGQNVAEDLTYSGTVAGALEGANLGLPRLRSPRPMARSGTTKLFGLRRNPCARSDPQNHCRGIPQGLIINVNFPACRAVEVQGSRSPRKAGATCKQSPSRSARMGAAKPITGLLLPAKIRPRAWHRPRGLGAKHHFGDATQT